MQESSAIHPHGDADVLSDLEPQLLWQRFDGIRRVPRPSKHEERIAAHIDGWADEHGFDVRRDAFGNRVVVVPASAGREGADILVLQSHLDMVCEKNAGVEHDFMNDPIRLARDGDYVRAVGTTLGADNGLGVAAAMAVATDPTIDHGPLELLFTLDEETGLNGAAALDPAIVVGRQMVNLDTEEDGSIYIGCAGAAGVRAQWTFERQAEPSACQAVRLAVKGFTGGHSGVEIHQPRGNAIKVMARLLSAAVERAIEFDLVSLDGGSKANAIPRECFAHLRLATAQRPALEALIEAVSEDVRGELGDAAAAFAIVVEDGDRDDTSPPLKTRDRDRLLHLLDAAHHGVRMMSSQVDGLVETSSNLAVVSTTTTGGQAHFSLRSSSNEALRRVADELVSLCRLAAAEPSVDRGYPGWAPNPSSFLLSRAREVHLGLFDEAAEIKAVHAGLECGLLCERLSGLDAVSIGPEILGAHSPDERVSITSTARFYRFLGGLLADLSAP